ncbi:MAG TPA: helix-turn-helix domain-containing protein [Bryobacteraceae bacterium]|nr:helix-turn-helix domain-containing protein [Bryobacteraceae bacterium]
MSEHLARVAGLIGEPGRAAMLLRLMSGLALPAGELAMAANVSPQTASGHLAKLVQSGLLLVERQGRHCYYRLSGTDVADALESLLVLTPCDESRRAAAVPEPGSLAHARTCYAHIAGWLGVRITDALQSYGLISALDGKAFDVTERGRAWFAELGISLPHADEKKRHKLARQCLDWTERRPHIAGTLGVALCKRFAALRWIAPIRNTRGLRVTLDGKRQLWERLRIPVA